MIQSLQVSFGDIACVLFNCYPHMVKNWSVKCILSVPLSVLKLAVKGRQTTFQVSNYYFSVIINEKSVMLYMFILIPLPILSVLLTYSETFSIETYKMQSEYIHKPIKFDKCIRVIKTQCDWVYYILDRYCHVPLAQVLGLTL